MAKRKAKVSRKPKEPEQPVPVVVPEPVAEPVPVPAAPPPDPEPQPVAAAQPEKVVLAVPYSVVAKLVGGGTVTEGSGSRGDAKSLALQFMRSGIQQECGDAVRYIPAAQVAEVTIEPLARG